ncbi:MAG: hypothetical protein U1E73_13845 [Planctomycetota bacterium]
MTSPAAAPAADPNAWIPRFRALRLKFALVVAAAALVGGGLLWLAKTLFSIRPGPGTPIGACMRTDRHVATWIERLEPDIPSLHRSGGDDRFTLAVLIVPLTGGEPRLVPVHRRLPPGASQLFRILGSDGRRLWVDGQGVSAIDLETYAVAPAPGPEPANLRGEPTERMLPRPPDLAAAGRVVATGQWLGVHAAAEVESDYGPKKFVRRVVSAPDGRAMRRLHRGTLEPDASGRYFRVASIAPVADREFCAAGFFRPRVDAEPMRLHDPDGALLVYSSDAGIAGRLAVARIDDDGAVRWDTDTGLDRFLVQQILPGDGSTVFVGTRPPVPDRVSEPLLVIVDHATGRAVTHSLWR